MYERWSTLHIEVQRRADFWRDASSRAFLPMTPRLEKPRDFRAVMVHRSFDGVVLNEVQAPAHDMVRGAGDVARGTPPFVFFNFYATGRCRIRQGSLDADVQSGQLLLLSGTSPYQLAHPDALGLISLVVPHALLKRQLGGAEYVSKVIPSSAAAALLAAQMRWLARWGSDLGTEEALHIADAMVGMVRAVLSPASAADKRNQRRLMQSALRQLIERRYRDPSLSAVTAAAALGVSVRTLHAWLAREGTTFGRYLLHFRLAHAHAILRAGPRHQTISEVAARCGFVSVAHFTRSFTQRYGATPSTLRDA